MRLFDIKTNIIPRIDPNCDSISESLNYLKNLKTEILRKFARVQIILMSRITI